MSSATLEALGDERYRVSGVLDARTTPLLLEQSAEHFTSAPGATIRVDFDRVADSDSAGLALLIEWLRLARQRQQTLRFANLPTQLAALARISEVDELVLEDAKDER